MPCHGRHRGRDRHRGAPPTTAAAAGDAGAQQWAANITALEQVQPADLGPEEIRAKLGAPWIPASDVRAFAAETLGYAPAVSYLPVIAQWEVKAEPGSADTPAATDEWGHRPDRRLPAARSRAQRQGTGRLRHPHDPRRGETFGVRVHPRTIERGLARYRERHSKSR
jgi:hypothetical protein